MSPIQSTTGSSSMAELKKVLPELSHPDGAPVRVLVVDDEPMIADLLSMGFTLCGWEVIVAHDGATAVELGTAGRPDLAILDVMLPDMDGLDVLERLRAHWSEMPAMFLTAKDATEDRVAGLAAGGDDYVTKPFSMEEVLIRAHRLVQRSGVVSGGSEVLVVGDLVMNTRTHEVTRGGDLIERLVDDVTAAADAGRYRRAAFLRDITADLIIALDAQQKLGALAAVPQLQAAFPDGRGGWNLAVVRHGRLAAAGRSPRGANAAHVAALLAESAETVIPGDGPFLGANPHELRVVHNWLLRDDVRIGPNDAPWVSPARGVGRWRQWATAAVEARKS